jgi:hypothetical protein
MRALAAVVFLSVLSASPPAFAETWRTKVALMEAASRPNCVDADVSRLFFDLTVTGSELSVKASSGETFSAPVAGDGSVHAAFTGSLGQNTYSLDLTGNVNTRDFEAFNKRYSCRFKLIPVR